MASSLSLTATFVLFSFLLSATLPVHASANSHGGFSVELIHRDSPKSPYYNAASTLYDRIISASHRSTSRADYLSGILCKSDPGFESQVIPRDNEYLMALTLGTPPVKHLLMADTGSNIIWTQCKPCTNCYKQKDPLFDPSKSSTYKKIGCQSPTCKHIKDTTCSVHDNTCQFTVQYLSGQHTMGVISSETVGFHSTTGRRNVSIPNLVFGCATDSNGPFPASASGLAGLADGPASLITQLRSTIGGKFAYCLVPYTNESASSVLSFGDKAIVKGKGAVTTPLVKRDPYPFYFVTLEDITVAGGHGGGKIVVNRSGSTVEKGNVVIDSGTAVTFLDENTVLSLEKQVSAVVKLPKVEMRVFRLCYDSTKMKSDSDLPDMTFKYTGGSVKLSPMNTFVSPEEGITCLAVLPMTAPAGIIGSIAQQNFHVGYDLNARTLTFAPANCANF